MSFVSYFIPQLIARFSSKHNRDILIVEESGKLKLLVNGSRQSGEYIEKLWKHALHTFRVEQLKNINRILVFGVGGGTVINLIRKQFPKAVITGVDIDQTMIDIGKKYFQLGEASKLTLVCDDAQMYVRTIRKHSTDMFVVDVFSGRHIPDFVLSRQFFRNIRNALRPNGVVLLNYLRELEYKEKSVKLLDLLTKLFTVVKNYQIAHNSFFFVVK